MKLSEKLKAFTQFSTAFLKSTFNFEHFERRDKSHGLCLPGILDFEVCA